MPISSTDDQIESCDFEEKELRIKDEADESGSSIDGLDEDIFLHDLKNDRGASDPTKGDRLNNTSRVAQSERVLIRT